MAPQSVLITGCSSGGIGHALALAFQERGLTVFATARTPSKMKGLESLPNVHLLELDVVSSDSVAAVAKQVEVRTGGRLDYLVNNAGALYAMPVLDLDIGKAMDLFEVNYWGAIRMIQAFSPLLIAAKGTIVNVGSLAGLLNIPLQSTYNASKAAMNNFSETLRLELAPFGVKVITLMAGNVGSKIGENSPKINLPPQSLYLPIQDEVLKEFNYSDMPTMKFAKEVVNDTLSGAQGMVWNGGNTMLVRILVPWLPTFLLDRLMLANGRGINKMPKA